MTAAPAAAQTHAPDPSPALLADMNRIVSTEAGYAERDTEAGGSVKYGISFVAFTAWEHEHGRPNPTRADHKAMPRETALAIYAEHYAPPIRYDRLAPGVGLVLLDSAVNNGVGGAIAIAQTALRLKVDHHVGAVTLWALTHREPAALINLLCDARLAAQAHFKLYRTALPKRPDRTWGQVWDERVGKLRTEALALISETKGGKA